MDNEKQYPWQSPCLNPTGKSVGRGERDFRLPEIPNRDAMLFVDFGTIWNLGICKKKNIHQFFYHLGVF